MFLLKQVGWGCAKVSNFATKQRGLRFAYRKNFVEYPIAYVRMSQNIQKYFIRRKLSKFWEFWDFFIENYSKIIFFIFIRLGSKIFVLWMKYSKIWKLCLGLVACDIITNARGLS